jgi:2-isopropylmalate synthase
MTEIHSDIESLLKKVQTKTKKEEEASVYGNAIFLDSESTIQQVADSTRTLGYDLSDEDIGRVYEALMRLCEQKSSIGGKELEAIVASTAMQVPATYKLKSYIGTMSNKVSSVTNVVLEREGEKLSGTGTGGGPIDSAFMAIEQCIGYHYELDDFQIQAVTEGKESLGSALVRLRSNGKLYSGNGLSSDICGASIRAYINALNKIAYEESQR